MTKNNNNAFSPKSAVNGKVQAQRVCQTNMTTMGQGNCSIHKDWTQNVQRLFAPVLTLCLGIGIVVWFETGLVDAM